MSAAFGVHVGNSCACIAVSKDGKTDVVANAAGDRVTPAMVGYADSEICVGLPAKQSRVRNLANTVTKNKFLIGGEAPKEDSPVTCTANQDGKYMYQVDYQEEEKNVSPEEILQHIYKYMHDIAASHCSNVDDSNTVITVPLTFKADLRAGVRACAEKAGFSVVQVVSEPVAACMAHGLEQEMDRRHILVYRVGGATMNATILLVSGGCYSIIDSTELRLGGDALTDVVTNYLGREFFNKYKEDILVNRRAKVKLSMEAEKVKHVLSTLDTAHCYVESLYDGMDFSTNVTRARFDNEISKVVSDLLAPITELFSRCNLTTADVSHVILSGGTTKVVKIQKQLGSMFPKAELNLNTSPDECIAIGAAVQASLITKDVNENESIKMLSVSRDIMAKSDQLTEPCITVVHADSTVPLRRNLLLSVKKDVAEVTVKLVFSSEVPLCSLTLPVDSKSKLYLGVHIHRDGSTHFTLTDKTSSKSTDYILKQASS
jgi:molecular chaperone DnaK (HSP70)